MSPSHLMSSRGTGFLKPEFSDAVISLPNSAAGLPSPFCYETDITKFQIW